MGVPSQTASAPQGKGQAPTNSATSGQPTMGSPNQNAGSTQPNPPGFANPYPQTVTQFQPPQWDNASIGNSQPKPFGSGKGSGNSQPGATGKGKGV